MLNRSTSILIVLIGLLLTAFALAMLYLGDSTLFDNRSFSLTTPDGDHLSGTFYPGSENVAVLLVEGFSNDQVSMRSLANEFNNAGFNVFTFDFSGQGTSSGSLALDYAATDCLARQVLFVEQSIPLIMDQSNLPLVVVGGGLGGRVALQSAVIDSHLIQGLVLVGPQLNLSSFQQPEFFTGVKDNILPWVNLLNPTFPNTRILILSGIQDDLLTPDAGTLLLHALTNDRNALPGPEITSLISPDDGRQWILFPDQIQNFEIFDSQIIDTTLAWSQKVLDVNPILPVSPAAESRGWLWVLGIIGISIAGEGSRRAIRHRVRHHSPYLHGLDVVNVRRFLWSKILLWLAAVPLMALLVGLMLLLPLPKPIFSLYYVGFIGGYGLLMLILYRFSLLPGTYGKLNFSNIQTKITLRRIFLTLEFNLAMFAILALYLNSGWNAAFPTGLHLVWVLILIPFTALGFWVGHLEIDLVAHKNPNTKIAPFIVAIISLLPFFIFSIALGILGSISGMVSVLQGMVILALVQLQGFITYRMTGIRWLTAILQAVMLYLLILPNAALFTL